MSFVVTTAATHMWIADEMNPKHDDLKPRKDDTKQQQFPKAARYFLML
jgi:hypothetical protein